MSLILVVAVWSAFVVQGSKAFGCGCSSVCYESSPRLAPLPPPCPLPLPCGSACSSGCYQPLSLPAPAPLCPLPAIDLKTPCYKVPIPPPSVTIPNIILALLPPSAKSERTTSHIASHKPSYNLGGFPFSSSRSYGYGCGHSPFNAYECSGGCSQFGAYRSHECGCERCCCPPPPITIPVPQPIPFVVREEVQCVPERSQPSVTVPNIIAALLPPTSKSCTPTCRRCC